MLSAPDILLTQGLIIILGMTLSAFTFVRVLLSLVVIASGLVVVFGLLTGKRLDGWAAL